MLTIFKSRTKLNILPENGNFGKLTQDIYKVNVISFLDNLLESYL